MNLGMLIHINAIVVIENLKFESTKTKQNQTENFN